MAALLLALLTASPLTLTPDWSKAPRVFTAANGTQVFDKPDGAVTAELRFGVPVKLLPRKPDAPAGWYRIASEGKAGYVPASALTSARYEDDFDGDGENELATVVLLNAETIRVRFWKPKEKAESGIDVPAKGDVYPEALKRSQAGLALIHLDSHKEACGDLADYWVSFVGGTPRVALQFIGLVDPPNASTYAVKFQPAKKLAVVKHSKVEVEDQPPVITTRSWSLDADAGVFTAPQAE